MARSTEGGREDIRMREGRIVGINEKEQSVGAAEEERRVRRIG